MKYLAIEGDLAHAIAMGPPGGCPPTADAPAALAAAAEAVRGNGCIDAPVTVFEGLRGLAAYRVKRILISPGPALPIAAISRSFSPREAVRALPSPARFWPHQWPASRCWPRR